MCLPMFAPMVLLVPIYSPATTPPHHSPPCLPLFRHKQHGSRVLMPLCGEDEPGYTIQEVAEAGRATLWCQVRIKIHTCTCIIDSNWT